MTVSNVGFCSRFKEYLLGTAIGRKCWSFYVERNKMAMIDREIAKISLRDVTPDDEGATVDAGKVQRAVNAIFTNCYFKYACKDLGPKTGLIQATDLTEASMKQLIEGSIFNALDLQKHVDAQSRQPTPKRPESPFLVPASPVGARSAPSRVDFTQTYVWKGEYRIAVQADQGSTSLTDNERGQIREFIARPEIQVMTIDQFRIAFSKFLQPKFSLSFVIS